MGKLIKIIIMKVRMLLGVVALTIGFTASAQTDTTGSRPQTDSTGRSQKDSIGNTTMGNATGTSQTDSMRTGGNHSQSSGTNQPSLATQAGLANTDKIGRTTVLAFVSMNAKGSQKVSAITPTDAALSASDKQLMMKVAAGGQRQLAISQAVLDRVSTPQIKLLAASEVEEQTGVAAKLKEIADAKNVTLPDGPDKATQALVTRIEKMSDNALDAFYINESGVKGHELLQQTMQTVNTTAKDEALKALAAATLPVIRTHLNVSLDIKSTMGGQTGKTSKKAAMK